MAKYAHTKKSAHTHKHTTSNSAYTIYISSTHRRRWKIEFKIAGVVKPCYQDKPTKHKQRRVYGLDRWWWKRSSYLASCVHCFHSCAYNCICNWLQTVDIVPSLVSYFNKKQIVVRITYSFVCLHRIHSLSKHSLSSTVHPHLIFISSSSKCSSHNHFFTTRTHTHTKLVLFSALPNIYFTPLRSLNQSNFFLRSFYLRTTQTHSFYVIIWYIWSHKWDWFSPKIRQLNSWNKRRKNEKKNYPTSDKFPRKSQQQICCPRWVVKLLGKPNRAPILFDLI